jgi:hypothetical protein
LQVAAPFEGVAQGLHELPQVAVLVLEAQLPLQACKPELQVNPQLVPSQVATLLAGGLQGVHEPPQVAVLVLEAQLLPQVW